LRPKFRDPAWHDWIHRLPVEELLRRQDVRTFGQRVANMAGDGLPDGKRLSRTEKRAFRSFLNLQADNIEAISVKTRGRLYGIAGLSGTAGLAGYLWSGLAIVAGPAAAVVVVCGIAAVKVGEDAREIEAALKDVARIFRRVARQV
jgi:hypothetical protein